MLLSDKAIRGRLILEYREVVVAKDWWDNRKWESIAGRIMIDPFRKEKLNACSYDLSIGEEWVSLRDPFNTKQLGTEGVMEVAPGETVLILTEEYVALPRNVLGLVTPRARRIFEGGAINPTRIDPTWYGKLLVGFTNLTKDVTRLGRGESFCTCCFIEADEVENPLNKSNTPHLGREKIGKLEFPNLKPQVLRRPEQITKEDVTNLMKFFGSPFDIVIGAIERSKDELVAYLEKDLVPGAARLVSAEATQIAYATLTKFHIALVVAVITAILAGIAAIVKLSFFP